MILFNPVKMDLEAEQYIEASVATRSAGSRRASERYRDQGHPGGGWTLDEGRCKFRAVSGMFDDYFVEAFR